MPGRGNILELERKVFRLSRGKATQRSLRMLGKIEEGDLILSESSDEPPELVSEFTGKVLITIQRQGYARSFQIPGIMTNTYEVREKGYIHRRSSKISVQDSPNYIELDDELREARL